MHGTWRISATLPDTQTCCYGCGALLTAQAGTQVDTLLSGLDNTVASLGQTLSSGLSVEQSSNIASTLNLGKIATLNSGLVTNSVLQLTAGSSVAQVLSLSTGILQSIVGSRPATLTGLLR